MNPVVAHRQARRRANDGGTESAPPHRPRRGARGTARCAVVVIHDHRKRRAKPLVARWCKFGTTVNDTAAAGAGSGSPGRTVGASCHHRSDGRSRLDGGANLAPPSMQTDSTKPLVARCGKFSATVTSRRTGRHRLNGVAKFATPLTAARRRLDGACTLPPPSPARPTASSARRRRGSARRGARGIVMLGASSRLVTDGSHLIGAQRFPQPSSAVRRGGTGPV